MAYAGAHVAQAVHGAARHGQQLFPGGRERQRHDGAVDQVGAGPELQGAHAARELRLGHVAQLGGPRKAAFARQGDEVFQPFMVHGGTLFGK